MPSTNANQFEWQIADLYRRIGCEVRHDVSLAGNQIDVVVTETSPSGTTLTRAVECKAYQRPVGIDAVRIFALTVELLRGRGVKSQRVV